jgi:hypothetical protein
MDGIPMIRKFFPMASALLMAGGMAVPANHANSSPVTSMNVSFTVLSQCTVGHQDGSHPIVRCAHKTPSLIQRRPDAQYWTVVF